MSEHLRHFAARVSDAPDFLACALAEYARSERLDDTRLAAHLSCSVDTLTHLRLCRMPREAAALFRQDVESIARRFSVDADILTEVTRRGQSLFHLRNPRAAGSQGAGVLLAARDDSRDRKLPPGVNQ
jgi:hypothetical protein